MRFCDTLKARKEQRTKMFSYNLIFYCKNNRYSQTDLANIIGVAPYTMNRYVKGTLRPTKEHQEIIFQKFGIRY